MLPILLFLIALPDIKRIPIEDELIKDFTVTEIIDETTADCSESPSSGGELAAPSQTELPLEYDKPLPLGAGANELNNVERITGGEADRDETPVRFPNPGPEPEKPIVVTPEPTPLAILAVSGAALLYLLFGRLKYNRSCRRN